MPGSVLRQLPANRDMDLFLGAMKVPRTFRDLDRCRLKRGSLIIYVSARIFLIGSSVKKLEFVVWKYIFCAASNLSSLKTEDEERKGEDEER